MTSPLRRTFTDRIRPSPLHLKTSSHCAMETCPEQRLEFCVEGHCKRSQSSSPTAAQAACAAKRDPRQRVFLMGARRRRDGSSPRAASHVGLKTIEALEARQVPLGTAPPVCVASFSQRIQGKPMHASENVSTSTAASQLSLSCFSNNCHFILEPRNVNQDHGVSAGSLKTRKRSVSNDSMFHKVKSAMQPDVGSCRRSPSSPVIGPVHWGTNLEMALAPLGTMAEMPRSRVLSPSAALGKRMMLGTNPTSPSASLGSEDNAWSWLGPATTSKRQSFSQSTAGYLASQTAPNFFPRESESKFGMAEFREVQGLQPLGLHMNAKAWQ